MYSVRCTVYSVQCSSCDGVRWVAGWCCHMEEEVVLGTVEDDVCYLTTTSHTSYRWHVHVAFPFLWLYTGVIVRRSQSHLEFVDVNDVSVSRKKSLLRRASLCFITVGAFCPVAFVEFFFGNISSRR